MQHAAIYRYPRSRVFAPGRVAIKADAVQHDHAEAGHDHDFVEVVFVRSGSALQRSPGGTQPLQPGDVIVLRPGAWHAYEQCRRLRIINCCFGGELLQHELAWMLDDPATNPLLWGRPLRGGRRGIYVFRLPASARRMLCKLLDDLQRSTSPAAPSSPGTRLARLILVLEFLAEHLPQEKPPSPARRPLPPLARDAVRLLENQIRHPWETRELAAKLGVDVSYAIRLVKLATGLSPLAYLSRLRAERAASLLVRSRLSVADVALQVGWEEPAYFARRFRSHFGLSASEYRKRFGDQHNADQ